MSPAFIDQRIASFFGLLKFTSIVRWQHKSNHPNPKPYTIQHKAVGCAMNDQHS